ncbi:MAG: alpha-L-fucosidase [Clostridia bacterium]|nr:alpha-L-fucosidase [Clostridia bacterium]
MTPQDLPGGFASAYMREAAQVVPSAAQLDWYAMEQYAFIHFGVNTFTDREWGDGTEPESVFAPQKLDCDQWVEAIKAAGLRGMVLTAKHHDGFCLWPSAYTEHSVKNSPCPVDVVKEAADACRRGGIRFGFYLSPWDRHSPLYGTPAYNDYYCAQLTELLTGYGDIFCVWFDNACAEAGKQTYDFERYIALVRRYQPRAVIFNDAGPDVRWCGNEAGQARAAEWAVMPTELCRFAPVQTGPGPLCRGDLSLHNEDADLGAREQLLRSAGLAFVPAEVDTSIRKGWFWHPDEAPKSLAALWTIYQNSVGHNACLHLNIPPNRDGLLDARDVQRLTEYGALLRRLYADPIGYTVLRRTDDAVTVRLDRPVRDVAHVVLREDLRKGQRIEAFSISAVQPDGETVLYRGQTVGFRQLCCLRDPLTGLAPTVAPDGDTLCIRVLSARDRAAWQPFAFYA